MTWRFKTWRFKETELSTKVSDEKRSQKKSKVSEMPEENKKNES